MCTVLRGGGTGLSHQIKLLLVETEEQLSMRSLSQEASPGFLASVWGVGGWDKGRTEGLGMVKRRGSEQEKAVGDSRGTERQGESKLCAQPMKVPDLKSPMEVKLSVTSPNRAE